MRRKKLYIIILLLTGLLTGTGSIKNIFIGCDKLFTHKSVKLIILPVKLDASSLKDAVDVRKTWLNWVDNIVTTGAEADVVTSTDDVSTKGLEVTATDGVIIPDSDVTTINDEVCVIIITMDALSVCEDHAKALKIIKMKVNKV